MKTSALNLLSSSSSGNDIFGIPQKASAYYSKAKSLQTLSWYLMGFVGTITIAVTLDADPESANYVDIYQIDASSPLTENEFINLLGKYTWMKATVTDYTAGSILKVSVGY